jgi:hypothetical protein
VKLSCVVLLLALAACSGRVDEAVSDANLLANEQWWPYRVQLREPWPVPGGGEPLPERMMGVLIRVEPSGNLRIDFGKRGKYEIPPGKTDIAERANQIRLGKAHKEAPNFVYAIRDRMVDPEGESVRGLPPERLDGTPGFLCVYADPAAADFEALARALAPLSTRDGVMTILFPQGTHADEAIFERLHALEWKVPFLYDFLSEPYTRTLVPDGTPFPYVMLQTSEGRVLLQGAWNPELVAKLDAELQRG